MALQHVRAAPPSPRSIRQSCHRLQRRSCCAHWKGPYEGVSVRPIKWPRHCEHPSCWRGHRATGSRSALSCNRSDHAAGLGGSTRRSLNPIVTIIPLALALGAIGLAAFGFGATSARAVPALAGQPIETARAAAASAAFTLEVTETARLDTPRGVVVAQDPPGGASVRDATIRAVVSTGVEVLASSTNVCDGTRRGRTARLVGSARALALRERRGSARSWLKNRALAASSLKKAKSRFRWLVLSRCVPSAKRRQGARL